MTNGVLNLENELRKLNQDIAKIEKCTECVYELDGISGEITVWKMMIAISALGTLYLIESAILRFNTTLLIVGIVLVCASGVGCFLYFTKSDLRYSLIGERDFWVSALVLFNIGVNGVSVLVDIICFMVLFNLVPLVFFALSLISLIVYFLLVEARMNKAVNMIGL